MPPELDVQAAATRIRTHLAQYPEAEDTLEGISRSWLQPSPPEPDVVLRALRALVADGTLAVRSLPTGSLVYSRADTTRPR